jgi:hypothetical protein
VKSLQNQLNVYKVLLKCARMYDNIIQINHTESPAADWIHQVGQDFLNDTLPVSRGVGETHSQAFELNKPSASYPRIRSHRFEIGDIATTIERCLAAIIGLDAGTVVRALEIQARIIRATAEVTQHVIDQWKRVHIPFGHRVEFPEINNQPNVPVMLGNKYRRGSPRTARDLNDVLIGIFLKAIK